MRKYPVVFGLLIALFLWSLGHQVMPATWSFYTKLRFGWSEAKIGMSLAVVGVIMALSQTTVVRFVVPRIGERRAALIGISIAIIGYVGYGTATQGWMLLAWLSTWFFAAIVMPTTNALMSHRIPADAQGELQGAVASLYSLTSILGPPLMTQLFGHFSQADASPRVPGAAFFAAAILAFGCLVIYASVTRPVVSAAPAEQPVAST